MIQMEEMSLLAVRSPVGSIAAALEAVEAAILRRDVARRTGEDPAEIERNAALIACSVLDSGIEYLADQIRRLEDQAIESIDAAAPSPGDVLRRAAQVATSVVSNGPPMGVQPGVNVVPTRDTERALLQLAGLSEALADRHVMSAFDAYAQLEPNKISQGVMTENYHEVVMRGIGRGRDVVCRYADDLMEQEQLAAGAAQSRGRMRAVSRVLAGVLITGTNATTALVLGPIAAAASTVIGSAATAGINIKFAGS